MEIGANTSLKQTRPFPRFAIGVTAGAGCAARVLVLDGEDCPGAMLLCVEHIRLDDLMKELGRLGSSRRVCPSGSDWPSAPRTGKRKQIGSCRRRNLHSLYDQPTPGVKDARLGCSS